MPPTRDAPSELFLVPPYGDPSLGWDQFGALSVIDLGREFVERVRRPGTIEDAAAAIERGAPTAESALRLLLLRAAAKLIVDSEDALRVLRGLGAALSGLSGPSSPVRLRLDDLELVNGTTQCSADALRAATELEAPFSTELNGALARCAGARKVRLWLEVDQQLPAALWLASRLSSELTLGGSFARAHWLRLAQLPPFHRCTLDPTARLPTLVGIPGLPTEAVQWCGRGTNGPSWTLATGPWGGEVSVRELLAHRRLAPDCRLAIVAFTELGETVRDEDGVEHPLEAVTSAIAALKRSGARVLAEWWVGAPGIDATALERTADAIERGMPFDRLVGLRRFRLPRVDQDRASPVHPERSEAESKGQSVPNALLATVTSESLGVGSHWGNRAVETVAPPAGHDLAREQPFRAERTLEGAALAEALERLAARLGARVVLAPGRLAQAYWHEPVATPPGLSPDRDCVLVGLPWSLDGAPNPSRYAVNLRTGVIAPLDARLSVLLEQLFARPSALDTVLGAFPEPQRGALVQALRGKSILLEK